MRGSGKKISERKRRGRGREGGRERGRKRKSQEISRLRQINIELR